MDIDEWCASSVFGALSPVAITLLPLHRFGINLLDLFPYGSFRDGLYANTPRRFCALEHSELLLKEYNPYSLI